MVSLNGTHVFQLMCQKAHGYPPLCQLLLDNGADPNATNQVQNSPGNIVVGTKALAGVVAEVLTPRPTLLSLSLSSENRRHGVDGGSKGWLAAAGWINSKERRKPKRRGRETPLGSTLCCHGGIYGGVVSPNSTAKMFCIRSQNRIKI